MSWSIIRSEEEYEKALERMEEIFQAPEGSKLSDEFDLLTLLINQYEEEHFPIEEADPISVIKMKMDYMGLSQKDLIPYFGSKSTASKILSYKSPLTLKHIWILSKVLKLPVELLAKPYHLEKWDFMKKFPKSVLSEIRVTA